MAKSPTLFNHRLRVMETVLYWEGEISNSRVRQLFGVQPVQASRLLAELRAKIQLVEDTKRKSWLHASRRVAAPASLDEYARHTIGEENGPLIDARAALSDPLPEVFAALRRAATAQTAAVITYASMTTPELSRRVIYPHSIVHVGRRWHVRAWCEKNAQFRDFTLGRIRAAVDQPDQPATQGESADKLWKKLVRLEIAAHSGLTAEQKQVIQTEFLNGRPSKGISVRACLLEYVIQDLRAAKSEKQRPPEYQLEVANLATLEPFLMGSN